MTKLRTARPLRVGLLWHSPNSGNLGVGALTQANLAMAREAASQCGVEVEFTIIGMRDAGAPYVDEAHVRTFPVDFRSLLSPRGCWDVIGRQDCVLDIGAGDSFADIYGPKRFGFLWLTKVFAIARRVPLVLSPQTIGPFARVPYIQMARFALERSRVVVARDETSLRFLEEIAPRARALLSADVAFALPFDDRSAERGGRGKLRVGVNVSGLLFGEALSGRNQFGLQVNYAELVRRLMGELARRDDVELHLLTHANGADHADDDGWAADLLAREFPSAIRAPAFASPTEAKSYISSLDFLTAGRMHACIAAYSAGTPVVPIAYSRKFSGLFGTLGYPWMVPVTGMSTDEALAYLLDALQRREELAERADTGMARVNVLLEAYRSELRDVFCAVAGEL